MVDGGLFGGLCSGKGKEKKKKRSVEDAEQADQAPQEGAGLFSKKFKREKEDPNKALAVVEKADPEEPSAQGGRARSQRRASASVDDSPEKHQRTVFVGNVPSSATKKTLKRLFGQFGPIESVRFRSQPLDLQNKMPYHDTALTRRIAAVKGLTQSDRTQKAYVVFKAAEHAEKAMGLNMTELDGKHIMVDFAGAKSSNKDGAAVQYDPTMSVFLGNLPLDVEEEKIIEFFNSADQFPQVQNQIEAVRVVHDKATGLGKGFGYVLFKNKNAAKCALSLSDELLQERRVRIMKVKANPVPTKMAAGGSGGSRPAAGKEDKRKKLSAFTRRQVAGAKAGKGKGAPSWQGMRVKGKIGKAQATGGKDKKLLSQMIAKHQQKKTTKNMKKKVTQGSKGSKKPGHPGKYSAAKK